MGDKSRIEWTDATWNPMTGCTPVSEGCEHCYAKRYAERFKGRFGYPADEPFRVTLHGDRQGQPLRWQRRRKIFVCSMGDFFHEEVPVGFIRHTLMVMRDCGQHTFIVLTKRPKRMKQALEESKKKTDYCWPLRNVWLGVTAENQRTADERIPILLQIPAAVRFVSVEPMLGPVDIYQWLGGNRDIKPPHPYNGGLDWVICGGESGPGARPMHPDWVRSLRDQSVNTGVPFFFKQWGEWKSEEQFGTEVVLRELGFNQCVSKGGENSYMLHTRVGKKAAGRLLDGREWNEWPEGR